MRIPITDKFLWDIYKVLSSTAEVARPLLAHRASMYMFVQGAVDPIFKKYRKKGGERAFNNLIYYLKRKGYIRIEGLKSKQAIMLTKGGLDKALKASFKMEGKKKRADSKWIMLIFDMPAKNKGPRALLRSILFNLGYKLFQQSVWVSPYDVSEKTEQLIQMHSLDKYVKIFIIEKI